MNDEKIDMGLYPKLTGETLLFDRSTNRLILFKTDGGAGYKVDGLAAQFCTLLNGTRTLRETIDLFRSGEGAGTPALDLEVERLLIRLKNDQLIEFREKPVTEPTV